MKTIRNGRDLKNHLAETFCFIDEKTTLGLDS